MTTAEMTRCDKCSFCVHDGSSFMCSEKDMKNVNSITDEECPLNCEV